jgi:iron complex transport system substrate-binding protein
MAMSPRRLMLTISAASLSVAALGACAPSLIGGGSAGASVARTSSAASVAASAVSYPEKIVAANGTITIAARPTAIVSLSPTATEMLYSIGAGSQVKAVDSYSDFPKKAPHTKLNAYQPNVEAIVAYRPDLVIVSGDTTGLTAQLAKFGIPTLSDPAATDLTQEYQQFTELGQATDHVAQAKAEVASIKSKIAEIVKSTPKSKGATYYFELEQDYYSVTSSTFIGQVLGLLGLKSIADTASGSASSGGYPQLSAEYIIKANPDYIFLADTICCGQTAKKVDQRAGWSTITAVKKNQIVGLNDDIASRWGPRVTILLQDVANALKEASKG